MKIDIEDIKALEPGKVYVVSLRLPLPSAKLIAEYLVKVGKECNIKFIFLIEGCGEIISAPEGLEVKQK